MIAPEKLALFFAASLAILLVPGPAVLYIVTRSLSQGRSAGLASVLGVNLAALTYTLAAALGLTALLLASALAFNLVKWAGAAYLVYLGVRQLTSGGEAGVVEPKRESLGRIFAQGYVVNLLNPKMAFFTFAFLPQFVDPAHGSVAVQILLLGGLFALMAVLSDGSYALLAGSLGSWFRRNPRFVARQKYVTGSVYIGLGVAAALTGGGVE
ncbi:LysE family translocator [Calidithermus chliarophilus]|uniref:LysE family translocator n=1 Tax=Calidithermus chliarophilus TaxID=52023 RepID=UPI0003F5D8E2|nr:LysE family translocator [Calidithermus chliarophilus]